MKKIALLALAASTAAIATPASAQTISTGTITLQGSVQAKCTVTGGTSPTTFAETVLFGELAQANGTLRSGLASEFATRSGTVVCTSGAPTIKIEAQPLSAVNAVAAPPAGYANRINYTASVAVTTTSPTNNGPFTDSSTTAGASSVTAIGGGMLANSASNINITTANYATPVATDILVADTLYEGKVIVTIAPN